MFNEETIKLIRAKTGDQIIQENPYKDNEGIGYNAPSKDEFIMNDDYLGK